jgi:cyclophilin family peptidyl-prolyl cis-trans isomerase/HEAT repeat protein
MFSLLCILLSANAAESTDVHQAIWTAEQARKPPTAFLKWSQSSEESVRVRTARALGRLRHAESRQPLGVLLLDPSPAVRTEAAFALGRTPGGKSVLALAANENHPQVLARIFDAIGHLLDSESMPWLMEGLGEAEPASRAAAVAIGRIGMKRKEAVDHPEIIASLVWALGIGQIDRRRAAAFALARIGPTAWRAEVKARVEALAEFDFDPLVRSRLVRALLSQAEGQAVVPIMDHAVKDRDSGVRIAACRGLAKLPPDRAFKLGTQLLKDTDWSVQIAAGEALVGLDDPRFNDPLLALRLSDNPSLQSIAGARQAMVFGHATESDWPVAFLAGWLSKVNYPEESDGAHNRPFVYFSTRSEHQSIRTVAAGRLLEKEVGAKWGVQLLKATDPVIQAAGISLLGKHPSRKHLLLVADLLSPDADFEIGSATMDLMEDALKETPRMRFPKALVKALAQAAHRPHLNQRLGALLHRLGEPAPPPLTVGPRLPPLAEIERIQVARILTEAGEIRIQLRPDLAPGTVWNFTYLAESDYFDGLPFHRVVPDFVIQTGCPRGDGWGGPGWAIPDELNWLPYGVGTLGMALSGPDTGGSQWFITHSDQPHLEGDYTVFGQLIGDPRVIHQIRKGSLIRDVLIERIE